jgi:hypothetical protein
MYLVAQHPYVRSACAGFPTSRICFLGITGLALKSSFRSTTLHPCTQWHVTYRVPSSFHCLRSHRGQAATRNLGRGVIGFVVHLHDSAEIRAMVVPEVLLEG